MSCEGGISENNTLTDQISHRFVRARAFVRVWVRVFVCARARAYIRGAEDSNHASTTVCLGRNEPHS